MIGFENTYAMKETDHESFEIRAEPLRDTVSNLPIIIDPMRIVELTTRSRRKTLVEPALESFDLVLSRLEVIARSRIIPRSEQWPEFVPLEGRVDGHGL